MSDEFGGTSFPQYRKMVDGEMKHIQPGDDLNNTEIVKIDYSDEYKAKVAEIIRTAIQRNAEAHD